MEELERKLKEAKENAEYYRQIHEGLVVVAADAAIELEMLKINVITSYGLSPEYYTVKVMEDEEVHIVRKPSM